MSVLTSVACQAQTPTKDLAKLSKGDVARIEIALLRNQYIEEKDCAMVVTLLEQNNTPAKGVVNKAEDIIAHSKIGDDWLSYISYQNGTFWLTYIVERKGKFIGRLDIRLD